EAVERFRSAGALRATVPFRILGMGIALRQGALSEVVVEAEDLAEEIELDALQAPHVMLLHAQALAWLGETNQARTLCDQVEHTTGPQVWFAASSLGIAKGECLLAEGRPAEALEQYREVQRLVVSFGVGHPQLPRWCAGAIEADLAERLYQEAFAVSGTNPLDRARIGLRFGAWLRRSRELLRARPVLAQALQLAEDCGAAPLAAKARAELAAAGGRRRRQPQGEDRSLTPQEARVADLAVTGATVKEIALAMYLSPRTVESHLTHIYRKVGVSSKAELRKAPPWSSTVCPAPC
ncbi:MAG: helix-turn-helix transcriptional regulator, partial [Actinobacteria bacterium]|nr:helix-turn-helix transcriptional regulator [Actinomycetota bacterium]